MGEAKSESGLKLGLHPGGLGLTVSPDESGEKYARHNSNFYTCAIIDKIGKGVNQILN